MKTLTAKEIADKHNADLVGDTPPEAGHNSAPNFAKDQLKAFVERVERLENEKAELASDIKSVYDEAAGTGFDKRALRALIRLRKQDPNDRQELAAILDTYKTAMGIFD